MAGPITNPGVRFTPPSDLANKYEPIDKGPIPVNPTENPYNFTVIRELLTLGLKNKATGKPVPRSEKVKSSTNKYFVLEVDYTPADTDAANRANKPLRLAYFDGEKWVPFEVAPLTNKVEKKTGHWRLELKEFIDPPISWGN